MINYQQFPSLPFPTFLALEDSNEVRFLRLPRTAVLPLLRMRPTNYPEISFISTIFLPFWHSLFYCSNVELHSIIEIMSHGRFYGTGFRKGCRRFGAVAPMCCTFFIIPIFIAGRG